jgi:hypothetical protein
MMFLGNSRVALGKNSTDPVLGEWKAVAPNGAEDGIYGPTGTLDEVLCGEWVPSYTTLLVGGNFSHFTNDTTPFLANHVVKFDGEWKGLTPGDADPSSNLVGIYKSSGTPYVYSIRDIKNGSGSKAVLVAGDFNRAGHLLGANSELNIALYSLDTGWTGSATVVRANSYVTKISNVFFDSTGITAYFIGDFSEVGGSFSPISNSANVAGIRYTNSSNTFTLTPGGDLDNDISGSQIYGVAIRNYDNSIYTIGIDKKIRKYANLSVTVAPTVYDITSIVGGSSLYNPPYSWVERATGKNNFLYLSVASKITEIQDSGNPTLFLDKRSSDIGLVFYNSGDHLVVVNNQASGERILFHNIETGTNKPISFPDSSPGAKINFVSVDSDTGTVYVGGKFVFQDSDGNTAYNVAKFVPDASKLP